MFQMVVKPVASIFLGIPPAPSSTSKSSGTPVQERLLDLVLTAIEQRNNVENQLRDRILHMIPTSSVEELNAISELALPTSIREEIMNEWIRRTGTRQRQEVHATEPTVITITETFNTLDAQRTANQTATTHLQQETTILVETANQTRQKVDTTTQQAERANTANPEVQQARTAVQNNAQAEEWTTTHWACVLIGGAGGAGAGGYAGYSHAEEYKKTAAAVGVVAGGAVGAGLGELVYRTGCKVQNWWNSWWK